jgi:methyl-accepting chemotaxis protein
MKKSPYRSLLDTLVAPLSNLRIRTRLILAFAGVFVLMLAMAGFAIARLAAMDRQLDHITHGNNQQIARVTKMIDSVNQRAVAVRNLALLKDADARKAELAAIQAAEASYAKAEQELITLMDRYATAEAEKALMEAIKRAETATQPLIAQVVELSMADKTDEAVAFLMDKLRARQARWVTVLKTLSGLQDKSSSEYADDANTAYGQALNWLLVFVAASLLGGIAVAWIVTASIIGPLGDAVAIAQTVAAGDLRCSTAVRRKDETGELLRAMDGMSTHLADVVRGVRNGSESIAIGTTQIASGNLDLSHRTEQQAANLQETAASMEQLRAIVRNNEETATQASRMASSASEAAVKGGQVFSQVVATMQGIANASKRIADITSVIDGIAFQTNILALNAAVEAARAGEQGRGFAVVASEVRSLAQRSAHAAKEIKGLISASAEQVDAGSALVHGAGDRMDDIVAQVRRVTAMISEITDATHQQTQGIDAIGDAMHNLDTVTQQNAALVEEAAASAESLRVQADQLLQSVSLFKLEASTGSTGH